MNWQKTKIEKQLEAAEDGFLSRKWMARTIVDYLNGETKDREAFYLALTELLNDEESERILLYLPNAVLSNSPLAFREAYLAAWCRLLNIYDARENFFEGDTFEVDARPNGSLERVVKCAHLTPWLLQSGMIDASELAKVLEASQDDEILLRSFKDTWNAVEDMKILSTKALGELKGLTCAVPERKKLKPLYVSERRKVWLNEKARPLAHMKLPRTNLEGPFSENLKWVRSELEQLERSLKDKEVVLVGGSWLKGYGTEDSDFDVWSVDKLGEDPLYYPGNPYAAHIYLNTIWLGRKGTAEGLSEMAHWVAHWYAKNSEDRKMSLERIESDLLQYRLLHKGFQRVYRFERFSMSDYPEMDGNCPFYDEEYRKLATKIFAKYIWLPQES